MYNTDACAGHATKGSFEKAAYTGHKYMGLYINKGGSLLLDVINIPVFLPIPPRGIRIHL